MPPLPGKALKRQLPFRGDDGIYEEDFIEERKKGLEVFVNKYVVNPLFYPYVGFMRREEKIVKIKCWYCAK